MKLSKLKATTEAVAFDIMDPETGEPLLNDEGKVVRLHMVGKASDAYQSLQDKYLRKAAERLKSKKQEDLTVDKIKQDAIETIVECSVFLEGLEDDDDKEIRTKEQFKKIYSDPALEWLTSQARQILEDDKNFMKRASKN